MPENTVHSGPVASRSDNSKSAQQPNRDPKRLRAVITGAGSGLGRALAMALAGRGASLMLADINEKGLEETARQARFRGVEVFTKICDVRDRDQVVALADAADEAMGHVDFVANNAGVAVAGPFDEISMDDWNWIVDINMWGVIYGCQAFVPRMRKRGRGYILNVASAAGLLNPPKMAPYNITKAAVVSLSETLHTELADDNIKVSVLCPTYFVTDIAGSARGVGDDADRRRVQKMMARSSKQAPDVAEIAVKGTLRGDLHILPMTDGRVLWGVKRAAPERFGDLLNAVFKRS